VVGAVGLVMRFSVERGWRIDVANDASLSPLQRIATAKCVPWVRGARRRRLRSGSRDREQLHAISRGGAYPAPAQARRAVVVASGWAVDDRETVAVMRISTAALLAASLWARRDVARWTPPRDEALAPERRRG
jgi:hypothetical protein